MPQMAPIWWTILFMMFNMSFLMMMINMYFQVNTNPTLEKENTSEIKNFNWKW